MNELETSTSPRVLELCRRCLKSFGQTVKLVSLYSLGHPVPVSSQLESWHLLHELFTESGWPEIRFSLVAGRWLANDQLVADSAQAYELLVVAFRCHAISSVTFFPECKLYEFTAFCELASTPPNRAYQTDAASFLKERGVRHIQANVEEFMKNRSVRPLASTALSIPQPAPEAPAPAPAEKPGLGFGSFIKGLVERSIIDPQERAQIYAEAVRHIESALARHVSEATHKLLLEKQGIVNERVRTENILASIGEGKVVVDQEGRILMMDPTAEEIIGQAFSDVAGKKLLDGVRGDDQFAALSKDLILPENRPISEEVQMSGGSEARNAFRNSVAVVHNEQGRVVGSYAVMPHAAKFREAQRLQEEFLANVTHDLKAPLTSICSALEVLAGKLAPRIDSEESEFFDICMRNSRVLRQMIDELLDFSKIKSGRMSVRPERQPLEPILRECLRALLPWAQSKQISLQLDSAGSLPAIPFVLADRGRVLQVLNNLVSNAIKFTPEGGRVTLSAAPSGEEAGQVRICVQDTGCGIAPEEQKRVFERFAQGQAGHLGGVGLGLAIARELVQQHRGRLWLESEPGRGSSFYFTLPIAVEKASSVP